MLGFNTTNDANQLDDQSSENLINFSTSLKPTEDESLNPTDPELRFDSPIAATGKSGATPRRPLRHSILKMDKPQMPSIIKVSDLVFKLLFTESKS